MGGIFKIFLEGTAANRKNNPYQYYKSHKHKYTIKVITVNFYGSISGYAKRKQVAWLDPWCGLFQPDFIFHYSYSFHSGYHFNKNKFNGCAINAFCNKSVFWNFNYIQNYFSWCYAKLIVGLINRKKQYERHQLSEYAWSWQKKSISLPAKPGFISRSLRRLLKN